MRYAIASDIHGSAYWCERFLEDADEEGADRIILLGDLLYHGPRNPLPEGYDPAKVASLLNERAASIIAVRGNCDSEVDQMVLAFPCMGDYAIVMDEGAQMLCTHGHLNICGLDFSDSLANGGHARCDGVLLPEGSLVFSGHTHVKVDDLLEERGIRHLNPGSVSLPKDGSHGYLIYDSGNVERRLL